jgi:hypothetical protein
VFRHERLKVALTGGLESPPYADSKQVPRNGPNPMSSYLTIAIKVK